MIGTAQEHRRRRRALAIVPIAGSPDINVLINHSHRLAAEIRVLTLEPFVLATRSDKKWLQWRVLHCRRLRQDEWYVLVGQSADFQRTLIDTQDTVVSEHLGWRSNAVDTTLVHHDDAIGIHRGQVEIMQDRDNPDYHAWQMRGQSA